MFAVLPPAKREWYFVFNSWILAMRSSINRAAMGRARFIIYPWFINRAAMGRARFIIYPWFIFCAGREPQTPLGQLWITQSVMFTPKISRWTLMKHKYTDNVTDVGFILWYIYIFFWRFSVGFEGNKKYAKKVLRRHGTDWRWSFHFRYVTNKFMFTLLVDLARSDRHDFICNFANISCGLRQMKWIIWLFHRSKFRDRKDY